ncbi:MAG: sigma-70 family RNA polymerase sigma factor [Myxococcota bacterium]
MDRVETPSEAAIEEEAKLVAALQRGEAQAYERLVRANTPRMLVVARRYLQTDEDARDAVQEAFVSAFRAIDRFEGGAQLSTWLHRIVVNACLMRLRTRRRKPEQSIEELLPRFREDGHLEAPTTGWRSGADRQLERSQTRAAVREAIDRLPESHRTVLLLRDIEGFDTEEAARELGITRGAVKTRLHRARLALREQLEPHFRRSEP